MTDREILEDSTHFEDIEETQGNLQCTICGGFYWYCECGVEEDQDKKDFQRWLQLVGKDV